MFPKQSHSKYGVIIENPYPTRPLFVMNDAPSTGGGDNGGGDNGDDGGDGDGSPGPILHGRVEKSPGDPGPEPSPGPAPDPEPEPGDDSTSNNDSQLAQLLAVALLQVIMNQSASASTTLNPLSLFPDIPLSPRMPRRPKQLPKPRLSQLPIPAPKPSETLQSLVQKMLDNVHELQHKRLQTEVTKQQETGKGRPDLIRALVDAYGPSQMQPLPSLERNQPPHTDNYRSPNNPAAQESLRNLLAPSAKNVPFMSEPSYDYQSSAQKPMSEAALLRQMQSDALTRQQLEAQQAYYQAQTDLARAQQQALQLQQWAASQSIQNSRPPLQAQITTTREERLLEQAFQDPRNSKQSILEQVNGPHRLAESKLTQVELNLDHLLAQGEITVAEYHQLGVTAKALAARNWLTHDGKDNGNGTLTYRGVTMSKKVAPLVAYADAKRYWDKNVHLSPQELAKAALDLGKGIYNFFIGDDLKTLQDPQATLLAKVLASGSLALTFGGGFVEKAGLEAIEKLGGKLLIRVSGKSEAVLAKLAEKGLNSEQIRNYKRFLSDRRLKNVNIYHLPDGGKVFEGIKEAKDVANSHTVWQKFVNADGKTIIYGHRTEYKDGILLHWHEKFPNNGLEIDLRETNGQPYIDHLKQILNNSMKGQH